MKYWKFIVPAILVVGATAWYFFFPSATLAPSGLRVPEGFTIEVVAKDLHGPRVIAFDPRGRMLVSELESNSVTIFEDGSGGRLVARTLLDKLRSPNGLAFFTDTKGTTYFYVAEAHQVARYPYDNEKAVVDRNSMEVIGTFSADGQNTTRTIGFGPNFRQIPILTGYLDLEEKTQLANKLYISVGSSCDVCVETSWKRGAILEADPEGTFLAEFAGGLRNASFFAFHPNTGQLWATEIGRGGLGDNLPPDEINIVKVADVATPFGARRYGWPFCYGKRVKDTTFNPGTYERVDMSKDCNATEPSYIDLPAHSSPAGLAFISDTNWPSAWRDDLLVAYHGSSDQGNPTGYKVVRVALDSNGNPAKDPAGNPVVEDFINGWLDGRKILGRPVDLKFHSGSLFISDDHAGVIYKVNPSN